MKYKRIFALDPSGSFDEGKGTTGTCLLNHNKEVSTASIRAKDYVNAESYWDAHLAAIDSIMATNRKDCIVVVEEYFLYASKAQDQINSRMETCRLLGLIQWHCYKKNYPIFFQRASEVKNRWGDDLLRKRLELPKVNRHEMDAVRHAMHYYTFRNDLNDKNKPKKKKTTVFSNF